MAVCNMRRLRVRFAIAAAIGLALVLLAAPTALAQPTNDDFANATLISSLPFGDTVDLTAATTEASEPSPSCVGLQNTAWYSFTPTTTESVSAAADQFGAGLAAYTGASLDTLTQVGCSQFPSPSQPLTFRAEANTTYYVQVGAWCCDGFGPVTFHLEMTPNPVAQFSFAPGNPATFDTIQFQDTSFDPAGVGIASQAWTFGDGAAATGCCPTHWYAAAGDYTVELTVATVDGRSASTSQTVHVRTPAVANDSIRNATVVTTLPFHDVVDLSQATFDVSTDSSRCNGQDHSVWYSFTPANDQRVAFDPSPSNQVIAIDVFTGSPDALSFVGCGQGGASGFNRSGFILNATAGTTYWIMASPICCIQVPILDLSVYLAVAPQATLTVNGGTVDRGGNAIITGTLDCVGTAPLGAALSGNVRQSVGRLSSVSAEFAAKAPCARGLGWTVLAQPSTGKFVGGHATVNATASVCNIVGCATQSTTAVVRLSGK
jgi:PKD repeat protein